MIRLLKSSLFQFVTQISRANTPVMAETDEGKDRYRRFHKEGPELFLTQILMVHGPLTNKELWRIYEKKLHEAKQKGTESDIEYWPSLTKMK
jgi:hypothetical protein